MSKKYRQEPPFAVQIELVEGCNLRCSFCGLNSIRDPKNHNFKFMTEDTLRSALGQIVEAGWNPRVEFAARGEPTQHPDYVGMVRLARQIAPRLQMMVTSNASGLLRKPGPAENVLALFQAGLNVLALDDYEGVRFVEKVRRAWAMFEIQAYESNAATGVNVYEYPENPEGNPHQRVKLRERKLVFIQDISKSEKGTHSTLSNHAGTGAPPAESDHPSQSRRCTKPFRELTVRWDGNVAVCCNDWRGIYKCGNVVTDGLDAVWNGEAMRAARQYLIRGERQRLRPCAGCDATSYRVGLLPDKLGREVLPAPGPAAARAAAAATAGPPYTAPVRRPWEA